MRLMNILPQTVYLVHSIQPNARVTIGLNILHGA